MKKRESERVLLPRSEPGLASAETSHFGPGPLRSIWRGTADPAGEIGRRGAKCQGLGALASHPQLTPTRTYYRQQLQLIIFNFS